MSFSRGDIIETCCNNLPLGTIFRYKSNSNKSLDDIRSERLFIICKPRSSTGKMALCLDDCVPAREITNTTYIIQCEIIRYGPK